MCAARGLCPNFSHFLGMAMATWWNLHLKPHVRVPISGGDNGGDNLFKGLFSRLGDRTSEDGARTPILKTIHIDPCQESTKGVKQFHGSFHNTQRKRLPAPSPYWKHKIGLSHLKIYWENIKNGHRDLSVTWNWDTSLQRSSLSSS